MREIKEIIIHCSATPLGKDFSAEVIRDWHVKGNGWDDIGYHFIIRLDGTIEYGRMVDKQGAHCKGHNRDSIGIAMAGGTENGKPVFNFTRTQMLTADNLAKHLSELYNAGIHGHNEFSSKACPSFDVKEWFYG